MLYKKHPGQGLFIYLFVYLFIHLIKLFSQSLFFVVVVQPTPLCIFLTQLQSVVVSFRDSVGDKVNYSPEV